MRFEAADIYPVITGEFCNGRDPLQVLDQVLAGGARVVQLREKKLDTLQFYQRAKAFRDATRSVGALLIINDRVDIALAVEADGVHLGQSDLPLTAARKFAPHLIIGVSTHSPEEALHAQTLGADYINIGPIFPTKTKPGVHPPVGIRMIQNIAPLLNIPFSVMGGINAENIHAVISAGARHIAMVTAITQADDIRKTVEQFRRMINRGNTPTG